MKVYVFLAVVAMAGFILIACSNRAEAPLIRSSAPAASSPKANSSAGTPFERAFQEADAEDRQAMLDRIELESLAAQPPSAPPAPRASAVETRPLADLPEGEPRVLAELPEGRPGLIPGVLPK